MFNLFKKKLFGFRTKSEILKLVLVDILFYPCREPFRLKVYWYFKDFMYKKIIRGKNHPVRPSRIDARSSN